MLFDTSTVTVTYISDSETRGGLTIVGTEATGLYDRFCSKSAVNEAICSVLYGRQQYI